MQTVAAVLTRAKDKPTKPDQPGKPERKTGLQMDYLLDIKPLEDAGKTDAQIADLLAAQTQTDMPNSVLRKYLHKNDLWLVDPATGLHLAGTIGSAYAGLTAPQKLLVRKLQTWVYQQESIETENDLDIALEFKTIINGMVTLTILTAANRTAIATIAGGLKHGDTTAQDIADVRAAYIAASDQQAADDAFDQSWATEQNEVINPAAATRVTATLVAALRASADTLEAG